MRLARQGGIYLGHYKSWDRTFWFISSIVEVGSRRDLGSDNLSGTGRMSTFYSAVLGQYDEGLSYISYRQASKLELPLLWAQIEYCVRFALLLYIDITEDPIPNVKAEPG